jgi:hypothetical protein
MRPGQPLATTHSCERGPPSCLFFRPEITSGEVVAPHVILVREGEPSLAERLALNPLHYDWMLRVDIANVALFRATRFARVSRMAVKLGGENGRLRGAIGTKDCEGQSVLKTARGNRY